MGKGRPGSLSRSPSLLGLGLSRSGSLETIAAEGPRSTAGERVPSARAIITRAIEPLTLRLVVRGVAHRVLHYYYFTLAYLLFVAFLGAGILCGIEAQRGTPVPFLASLFMTVSAVSGTGLVALDLSTLSVGSQVVIFIVIILGGLVLMSATMPLLRWWNVSTVLKAREAEARVNGHHIAEEVDARIWAGRVLLRDSLSMGVCILLMYWACVQLLTFGILAIYTSNAAEPRAFLASRGVTPLWFSGFHAIASFNNSGFTLFTDNLTGLARDRGVLLVLAAAIPLGNVGSPVALRALLRLLHWAFPSDVRFRFLLAHPRVVFLNVFSSRATKQLLLWLVLFTLFQFVSFLSTDFDLAYLSAFEPSTRALIAFFSAVSTRTAGFNVVNMIDTSVSQQLVCAIMMFLASTPLLAAQRSSTLTQEDVGTRTAHAAAPRVASGEDDVEALDEDAVESELLDLVSSTEWGVRMPSFRTLSPLSVIAREVPLLLGALLLMCYADDGAISEPGAPRENSVFGFMFELASAYGTSGLSLCPRPLSTSGYLSPFSQLIIMAVMMAGRMRGLPLNSDPTAQLYSEWGTAVALVGEEVGGAGQDAAATDPNGALKLSLAAVEGLQCNEHAYTLGVRAMATLKTTRKLDGAFSGLTRGSSSPHSPKTPVATQVVAPVTVAALAVSAVQPVVVSSSS